MREGKREQAEDGRVPLLQDYFCFADYRYLFEPLELQTVMKWRKKEKKNKIDFTPFLSFSFLMLCPWHLKAS